MNILAVIPARKGSKGINKKNHLKLNKKTLVEISVENAEKSKFIDKLILTSDDKELIKEINKKKFKKLEIPFVRPKKLSGDRSSSFSVLKHSYNWLIKNENWKADIVVLLSPTTPFRTTKIIDKVIYLLKKNKKTDAVITITDVDYPPHWMVYKKNGKLHPIIKNGNKYTRRQDTPKVFKPAGLVYALRSHVLKNLKGVLPNKNTLGYYVNTDESINIDNYDHYLMSKIKIKNLR